MKTLIYMLCLFAVAGCATCPVITGSPFVIMSMDLPLSPEFCSRPGPPEYESRWFPSYETVLDMEDNFLALTKLKAELCCFKGAQVRNPRKYMRQYFGIVVQGRKLIYINAVKPAFGGEPVPKDKVLDNCHGGICCWGALYDPETKEFFDLAFNGLG